MPTFDQQVFRTLAGLDDRFHLAGHALDYMPFSVVQQIPTFAGYRAWVEDWVTGYRGAATGETDTNGWRIGETGTSAVALETTATGAVLKIATGGTDDNCTALQRIEDNWYYVLGKRMWCFAKFNLDDVDLGEALFGLIPATAATGLDTFTELLALDDGIYWEKAVTATKFDFHVRKNDVDTENTLVSGTFADATDRILGFTADAQGNIAMSFNSEGMYRASIGRDGELFVGIYADE